uniref:Uncharacterized protein n=1 Tax=Setaria italica TaxID=4555 RepID=K4AHP8_SETIT
MLHIFVDVVLLILFIEYLKGRKMGIIEYSILFVFFWSMRTLGDLCPLDIVLLLAALFSFAILVYFYS